MIDLISRQAAKEKACSMCRWEGTENCAECEHPIDDLPTIDAVKHGKWITKKDACGIGYQICSNCETEIQWRDRHGVILRVDMQNAPYCPYCGARMEGSEE